MTTTSGGNLSIREENGDIWITPARVDKGALTREDIVLVRADGTVEGRRQPSSELPLHLAIYRRARICTASSTRIRRRWWPSAWCTRCPIRGCFTSRGTSAARLGFAAYELPGSEALGRTPPPLSRKDTRA